MKKIVKTQSWYFLILLIFFSCSAPCPKIEDIEAKGNQVVISMIECGSSKSLFDLKLNLSMIENPNDSISNKKYVHIPKEKIELQSNKDFNYSITVNRFDYLNFTIGISLKEGNTKKIEGTDFEKMETSASATSQVSGPGWSSIFIFDGSITEQENGDYKIKIKPSNVIDPALNIFNKANATFNKNYSLDLAILSTVTE